MKNTIAFFLKLCFAASLIYWLISSGKLDLILIKSALSQPERIILTIILLLFVNALAAFRWRIILNGKSDGDVSLLEIFKANWIGIFFNTVLPGSVSGDIVKIFYIKNKKLNKKFLLGSIFFDRVVGLFGLICIGAAFGALNYSSLSLMSPDLMKVLFFNFILFTGVIIFSICLFKFSSLPHFGLVKIGFINSLYKKVNKIWSELVMFKANFFKLLILSIAVHFSSVLLFGFIIAPYTERAIPLSELFSLVPAGFISIAIPIAPAGLGVGHAVFDKVFSFINISNGANLFNLYFVIVIMTNLTGFIPYIFSKKPKK